MQPVQRVQKLKDLAKTLQFADRESAEDQIGNVVYQLSSLSPVIDDYVYNDGTSTKLLKLDGTIPITYRGTQYNIPVALWFPLQFPKVAPMCYVTPVQGMKVKPHHLHVDVQGVIYHPYIHEWNPKSSLIDLIGLLCSVFGKDPPVFSERKISNAQQNQNQNQNQNPFQQPNNSQIIQQPSSFPQIQSSQSFVPSNNQSNNFHPNMMQHSSTMHSMPSQSQPQSQSQSQLQTRPHSLSQSQPHSQSQSQLQSSTQDLKSKVETEVRKSLQSYYDKENNELNMFASKQKDLETRRQKLDEMKKTIMQENQQLTQRKKDLDEKIKHMEQWLKVNEKDDFGNIDDIIVPSDTWSKQCMDAVSEEFALGDVMLELDKAIEEETIQLDVYLKQLRKIAREQFMKKALSKEVHKIQDSFVQKH